jgi:hypothetical protein
MRTGLWTTTIMALALSSATLHAQESSLLGTWSGEVEALLEVDGSITKGQRLMTLVIDEVDGSHIRGYRHWQSLDTKPGNVAGNPTLDASEPFIGALASDGVTLRLVETQDQGLLFCELLGPDQLEVSYMEAAPHAVAWTAILQRQ